MENNVSIAVVNKNVRFNGRVNYMLDNAKNKVGSYSKEKVEAFKKKMVVALEKAYDTYVDFDIAINDAMDAFGDRLIDGYENFAEKIRELSENHELRKRMQEANPENIKKFDTANINKKMKMIYEEVLYE